MPSPWIDLLCLHGYITDSKLLRKLATRPSTVSSPEPRPTTTRNTLAKRAVTSLRMCLGIGDGMLRSQ